jgi:hypothetical protein
VVGSKFNELDYCANITNFALTGVAAPTYSRVTVDSQTVGNSLAGNVGSACYASAISLETSNGLEISGLNAEEQVPHLYLLIIV